MAAGLFLCGSIVGRRGRNFKIFASGRIRKSDLLFCGERINCACNREVWYLYLDVLLVLNFAVDLLLLIATNRLAGYPNQWGRVLLASVLGGLYGSLCILPGLVFLSATFWRLVFLFLIGCIAFGVKLDTIRRCVLFSILSMALGGVALGIGGGGFLSVLLCAGVVCLMCIFGLKGKIGNKFLPIEIIHNGKTHRFTALIDTGNMLTDPVTGQQIIVVSSKVGCQILEQKGVPFEDPVAALECIQGGRLVPYHCIGNENGLLVAKRFRNVRIGRWYGTCLVAFSPQNLGAGQSYEALTGGNLWA